MFLLGAGASVDAGLASSIGLTKAIAGHIGRGSFQCPEGQLLHAVIGSMIQRDAGAGGDAFSVPDVERVFSAVSDLKQRDSLDLTAFVDGWSSSLDAATGRSGLPASWGAEFIEALNGKPGGDHPLRAVFERGVQAITEPTSWQRFEDLERKMLMALVQVLKVDPDKLEYLNPMVSSKRLNGIATLNYDLSVETACSQSGLSFDTGLERWKGGYGWRWTPNVDVRLLKLHGSLDYVLHRARPRNGRMSSEHLVATRGEIGVNPALVFGVKSKLRSDGPFLAMLVELDKLLARTAWLSIVGYSFRDQHINAALTRWMNGGTARRLSVIDPQVEEWTHDSRGTPKYFAQLREAASGKGREFGKPASWAPIQTDFVSMGAAEGLAELHRKGGGQLAKA